jgi:hypothetical protein
VREKILPAVLAAGLTVPPACAPHTAEEPQAGAQVVQRVHVSPDSDEKAIEIAQAVVERMGGWESWDATRQVRWKFFGRRVHYWDRWSGDSRIEWPTDEGDVLLLMNVNTRQGRAWIDGEALGGEALEEWLQKGHEAWINDSYWMFMPYKLLDPGVTLKHAGEHRMEDGRPCDVLELTFADGVGYTPQNRYRVFVARDTRFVEAWAFYTNATDDEPQFTLPWENWQRFGRIFLATGHGQGKDWQISVHDDLPASVFVDPGPVGALD